VAARILGISTRTIYRRLGEKQAGSVDDEG
jgi:hypothetical protein